MDPDNNLTERIEKSLNDMKNGQVSAVAFKTNQRIFLTKAGYPLNGEEVESIIEKTCDSIDKLFNKGQKMQVKPENSHEFLLIPVLTGEGIILVSEINGEQIALTITENPDSNIYFGVAKFTAMRVMQKFMKTFAPHDKSVFLRIISVNGAAKRIEIFVSMNLFKMGNGRYLKSLIEEGPDEVYQDPPNYFTG